MIYNGGETLCWLKLDTGALTAELTLDAPPTHYPWEGGQVIQTYGIFSRMRGSRNLEAIQDMTMGVWQLRLAERPPLAPSTTSSRSG